MIKYEEHQEWSTFWSWAFIIILSGGLITWAMSMMLLVEDVPREWDFGNIEYTPGASVYSTYDPDKTPSELEKIKLERKSLFEYSVEGRMEQDNMIIPLPEGIPMEKFLEEKRNIEKNENQ